MRNRIFFLVTDTSLWLYRHRGAIGIGFALATVFLASVGLPVPTWAEAAGG